MKHNILVFAGIAMLSVMAGCSKQDDAPSPTPEYTYLEEAVTWADVEETFVTREAELQKAEADGYRISEDELPEVLSKVAEGYETFYNEFKDKDAMLELYTNARKLETSDNKNHIKLGQAAQEFLFSCLGFNASDPLIAQYSYYSQLMVFDDQIDIKLSIPRGYVQNFEEELEMSETEISEETVTPTETPTETILPEMAEPIETTTE